MLRIAPENFTLVMLQRLFLYSVDAGKIHCYIFTSNALKKIEWHEYKRCPVIPYADRLHESHSKSKTLFRLRKIEKGLLVSFYREKNKNMSAITTMKSSSLISRQKNHCHVSKISMCKKWKDFIR